MQRELRLTEAYRNVFGGSPTREDQELVLVDLAKYAGWSMVTPPDVPDSVLRQNEGKRELFLRIRSFLNLNDSDVLAIENAARREAVMSEEFQYQT